MWCDVDVVEFSYFGAPNPAPKEQLYTEIVDDLRGSDLCIGSGSQVHSCFFATSDLKTCFYMKYKVLEWKRPRNE